MNLKVKKKKNKLKKLILKFDKFKIDGYKAKV